MSTQKRVLIVGAGLAGSVLARALADAGVPSLVIDRREHVAGMCYSSRDEETGVEVHRFGPHTFHTSNERVWEFVQRFDTWYSCVARAMCTNARGVFSLPINLHTINQLFGKRFSPAEARAFIETLQDKSITAPANAEEQLLRFVGREIYETFFRDYTIKQWGVSPRELAADIVKRIPVRFTYDNNYFFDKYQGYPMHGYTALVQSMLNHPLIEVKLHTVYSRDMNAEFEHVFYSGPLDAYFDYAEGELGYRTVDFRYERGEGDLQGCSWLNYTDMSAPFTRAHEHKYFSPWETHDKSVLLYEYSREAGRGDDAFYPKRMPTDLKKLASYLPMMVAEQGVSFIGRLGCYRYLDMHVVVEASLRYADVWLAHRADASVALPKCATPAL
ncbi:MAG: NAD(P)-binding protein [Akkermansia sp.]|nr:NAD(P)-binding protein [Akkermansia sp.]